MLLSGLVDEDFVNYKKPSMFIGFPNCTFKCEKDCGIECCQNKELNTTEKIQIKVKKLVDRYLQNPLTTAVVCGGLEPFDSKDDLFQFISLLRDKTLDDIVIYTGYYEDELKMYTKYLSIYKNILVKFGRYVPNQKPHYDENLGVYLSSDNQYSKWIS